MADAPPHATIAVSPPTETGRANGSDGQTPLANALAVLVPSAAALFVIAPQFLASHFGMVPVNTFLAHRYLWNILTHVVVEPSLLLTLVDVACVLAFSKSLERVWGTRSVLLYLVFVAGTVGLAMLFVAPLLSAFFNAPFAAAAHCGFTPCAIALAVANWQQGPDSTVSVAGVVLNGLRASHVPFVVLLYTTVVEIVAGPGLPEDEDIAAGTTPLGTYCVPAAVGLHAAWFYLRFLRGAHGDPSTAMMYENLFPGPLRVLARVAARAAFPVVRVCGLGDAVAAPPTAQQRAAEVAREQAARESRLLEQDTSGAVTLPGSNPSVADRRRQVALAALAERLQRARDQQSKTKQGPAGSPTAAEDHEARDGTEGPVSGAGTATEPTVAAVAGRRTPTAEPREAVDF